MYIAQPLSSNLATPWKYPLKYNFSQNFLLLREFYYSGCDLRYKLIPANLISFLLMRGVIYYSEVWYCEIPPYD